MAKPTGNFFIDMQNEVDERAENAAQRHRDDVVIMEQLKRMAYDGAITGRSTPFVESLIAYEAGIVKSSAERAAHARAESCIPWP